jgi:hypothetical protein
MRAGGKPASTPIGSPVKAPIQCREPSLPRLLRGDPLDSAVRALLLPAVLSALLARLGTLLDPRALPMLDGSALRRSAL